METLQALQWRWLILVSALMETFLFGGVVFGWGSLVFVLKQEGIFAHLCSHHNATNNDTHLPVSDYIGVVTEATNRSIKMASGSDDVSSVTSEGTVTCERQDDMLSLCFTITSAILYGATSVAGFIAFRWGTRVCRLIGWASFTLGSILLALTSPDNPWLLFGGLAPLGYGGVVLLITNIQVGILFTKGASTVIAALSGLYDSSSVIMLLLKFAHENGFRRRHTFLVLGALHVLTLLSTVVLLPRSIFTWTSEQHCLSSEKQVSASSASAQSDQNGLSPTDEDKNDDKKEEEERDSFIKKADTDNDCYTTQEVPEQTPAADLTLKDHILSTLFLLEVAWMALLQLRYSFFLASYNPWLTSLFPSEEEVSFYTNVSMYSMMAGLPISLLSGALFDFFKHVFAKQSVVEQRHVYPAVVLLGLTSSLAVLLSTAMLLDSPRTAVWAGSLLAAGLRSFLYSVDANIITLFFPPKYFTALFSVCDFVGGVVSLFQYVFVLWFQSAGFTVVNSVMLAVAALTFVHPAVQLHRAATLRPPRHSHPVAVSQAEGESVISL